LSELERVKKQRRSRGGFSWFKPPTFGITAGNPVTYPLEKSTTTSQACLSK